MRLQRRSAKFGLVAISLLLPAMTAQANDGAPADTAAEVAFGAYYYSTPGYRPPTPSPSTVAAPRRYPSAAAGAYRWREPASRYAYAGGYGPRPYAAPAIIGRYDPRTGYIYQDFADRRSSPYAAGGPHWRWPRW